MYILSTHTYISDELNMLVNKCLIFIQEMYIQKCYICILTWYILKSHSDKNYLLCIVLYKFLRQRLMQPTTQACIEGKKHFYWSSMVVD